ncbi:MAG: MotA/TolQ/ExbB proton channel family protein [Deltaproteobacteria bacterium]|nr:MotA/TolQ/ExbB proton channel family protein [Deltaproteobacteria bacterium]
MLADLLAQSRDFLEHGGRVMLPLIAISLLMWFLIIYKSIVFAFERRQKRSLESCWRALQEEKYIGACWQQAILRQLVWLRRRRLVNRENLLQLTRNEEVGVDRFIKTILVLAGAAPLLGLLGTVSGMITTFDVIAAFGTGNARAMAAGISEALITTQAGLVVAVPGLLLGAVLQRRADRIKERMHSFSLNLLRVSSF